MVKYKHRVKNIVTFKYFTNRTKSILAVFVLDCCLFIFLDGSAFYLDDFLEKLTGFYRLMAGTVNGYPHFVSRSCRSPNIYGSSCTYIWYSGYDIPMNSNLYAIIYIYNIIMAYKVYSC